MADLKPSLANRIDNVLRGNSALPRMDLLRDLLRAPYYRALSLLSNGLDQNIGGAFDVKLEPRYCSKSLPNYERESCAAIRDWVNAHPDGTVVDIGCSKGYISAGILFQSPNVRVKGIDSDFQSLGICKRMCAFAPRANERLSLTLAMLAESERETLPVGEIMRKTDESLRRMDADGNPRNFSYLNMNSKLPVDLPFTSVDHLFLDDPDMKPGQCLLKCDVEGAEMMVLRGSSKFVRKYAPDLILSVHPDLLLDMNESVQEVVHLLSNWGYTYQVIGVDHEEHWYCRPQ